MNINAYELAQRYIGIKEVAGPMSNPQILSMLRLDDKWPEDDSVPWCSAFINHICWLLRLPRSKSLAARSWLEVGEPVKFSEAKAGYDVVIIKRKASDPGSEVIKYQGHVGFFSKLIDGSFYILGGNQSNSVTLKPFNFDRLLGIRRLYNEPVFSMSNDDSIRMV